MFIQVIKVGEGKRNPGFKLENNNKITTSDIDRMMSNVEVYKLGGTTTIAQVTLLNGFKITETNSCSDPVYYDEQVGKDVCMKKVYTKIQLLLEFLLQSSINGFPTESEYVL